MPRTKEFDRDEVLERALDIFWQKGYESTSLQDLVEGMGIGRASLYDTFGSKGLLFGEAMDRYGELLAEALAPLRGPGSPRRLIADFFRKRVDDLAAGAPSCLMIKSTLTRGQDDAPTACRCADHGRVIEDAFHDVLLRARHDGEISADKNPRALARFLNNSLLGLNVMGSIHRDKKLLREIARTTVDAL